MIVSFFWVLKLASQDCGTLRIENQTQADNLPPCTTINGDLFIGTFSETNVFTDLSYLEQIESVSGLVTAHLIEVNTLNFKNLTYAFRVTLENIDADSVKFPELLSVGNDFELVSEYPGISPRSLSLNSLDDFEIMEIRGNLLLNHINLSGLMSLEENELIRFTNNGLAQIAFPELTQIEGRIFINFSPVEELSFDMLVDFSGSLDILNSNSFRNILFPSLQSFSGGFAISNSTTLENIDFFEGKIGESIGGMSFVNNSALTDFSAIENVKRARFLRFKNSINEDMDFLSSLVECGTLLINDNQNLTSIQGLKALNFSDRISIYNNPLLMDCCVSLNWFDAGFIEDASLFNNAPACSGKYEIALNCSDVDMDGIVDVFDNCPTISNPDQSDQDNNGIGDACQKAGGSDGNTLHQEAGDIFIKNIHRGIIMQSADGSCFRIKISNEGTLSSQQVNCPN